ncbi:hypothetical protein Bp8pC_170 [Bacillus phage Bp8p-C]|uniref:Uncharacterized protein n=2 Tax=Agatevirus Bp8pC TaxID=1910937 RepID=A0A0A0PLK2_9CAUD|nr:hypothetical protein AXJ20_gp178 [Bacillus phage Bp8p-C]YP_009784470.1 hypothetical protein QLX39_gp178 [Bacillus phage Bp8p-T]AHJ87600.1 hypothetical protein Bp8pC_170 [Bacillus phage Bp8p-C]AHJ87811.1 hypothetical protein Bp8pT_170 [Bacillus phage Bp8p-T]
MNHTDSKKWNRKITVVHTTPRSMKAYHEGEPFYAFVEPFVESCPVEVYCDYIQPLHMGLVKICSYLEPSKPHGKLVVSEVFLDTYLRETRESFTSNFPQGSYDFEFISGDIIYTIHALHDMNIRIDRQRELPKKSVSGIIPSEILSRLEKVYLDGNEVVNFLIAEKGSE